MPVNEKALPAILWIILVAILGLLFSWFWLIPAAICLLIFIPVIWIALPNRWYSSLFILSYYLGALHEVVVDMQRFFDNHYSLVQISGLWLGLALLLSLPWCLCYPAAQGKQRYTLGYCLLLVLLISLPPLGIINIPHPLFVAGYWFPGLGWHGLAATVLLILVLIGCVRYQGKLRLGMGLLSVVLIGLAWLVNAQYQAPKLPEGWVALQLPVGPFPDPHYNSELREKNLLDQAEQAISSGYKTIVFPECSTRIWLNTATAPWQNVKRLARQHGANLLIGAERLLPDGTNDQGVMILGKQPTRFLAAYPPVPWTAVQTHTTTSSSDGLLTLDNSPVAFAVYYEDTLVWHNLEPLLAQRKPDVIIAFANEWWDLHGEILKQRWAIASWARLFGLPLIHAMHHGGLYSHPLISS